MNKKSNNAITLIALVITIIILLILATISIQAITQTGLFKGINTAKLEDKRGKIAEYLNLKLFEEQTKNYDKTEEEIIKETRENIEANKKELLAYGKDIEIEEIQKEKKDSKTNIFFNVIVDEDIYKVELSTEKEIIEETLSLDSTSGIVVDGESKTITISGENYGTLTVSSNDTSVAIASIDGNIVTVTGTITSGTKEAIITIRGSEGGVATYTVTAHKHTGDSSSGGGCYTKASTSSYTYYCDGCQTKSTTTYCSGCQWYGGQCVGYYYDCYPSGCTSPGGGCSCHCSAYENYYTCPGHTTTTTYCSGHTGYTTTYSRECGF